MGQTALFVAGGSGTRMNTTFPKQFLKIHGLPLLMQAINRFLSYNKEIDIRIVLPEAQINFWKKLCENNQFTIKQQIFKGGENRFQSVKNGLEGISHEGLIAIHDGVRPLVSIDTISRCFKAAEEFGAAIPVVDIIDTIRHIDGDSSITVNRDKYKIVQTPQVFQKDLIIKAYAQAYQEIFTDDASVVESIGHRVTMVEGNIENIKITKPSDLKIAEALFKEN